MNNSQFRNLILDGDKHKDGQTTTKTGATPSTLGSKKAFFVPMTPRAVKGGIDVDFARQVRERNAALQPTKKYKSAAPKGVKYAAGYTDRAKARAETENNDDDKASRIKALEEQMKLGQISEDMFESLRDQITGGDITSTHLVKGLDRQLLERVRRGENVLGTSSESKDEDALPDVEEELDKLGERQVETMKKEKVEKKGSMAPPSMTSKKRSRDELMAELRAQRKAAAEARAAPLLNGKWKKVGDQQKSRVEVDDKGREVLITVDEDGVVKKKVRKARPQAGQTEDAAISMPDAGKDILGADVAIPVVQPVQQPEAEDEDDDIFEGVGIDYNPLGNDDEDESDSDSSTGNGEEDNISRKPAPTDSPPAPAERGPEEASRPPVEEGNPTPAHRNYFKDAPTTEEEPITHRQAGIQDLLKKAAKMEPLKSGEDEDNEKSEGDKARLKRRAEMLAQEDRDMDDMDMGFGGGRYDDEGEEDGKKMRLSEWKGGVGDEEGWEEGDKEKGKKKRKPKKRKGDVNNAADVMRVIEGRKSRGN